MTSVERPAAEVAVTREPPRSAPAATPAPTPVQPLATPARPATKTVATTAPVVTAPKPVTSAAPTSPPATGSAAPRFHTIAVGETLSKISLQYYGTTARWTDILAANRDLLRDERSLVAGRVLRIP